MRRLLTGLGFAQLVTLAALCALALPACAPSGHPYLELSAFEICQTTCADRDGLGRLDFEADECICSDGSRFPNSYCEPGLLSCVPYFDSEDALAREMEWLLEEHEGPAAPVAPVGSGPR